ncbi:MOSC domain-containing protein [Roseicitreum antarcticum]|uniref:MOSC domain-containing protein n=1 Tax=Roseicitreum antarcticum TaxID=564137 RepID=A0A1H2X6L7_9RHOB|nr:MOSC domain-containing protein [Roseicitreum antarcticum]SDW87909.1 hypothetical protein SAMN04488238_10466 [Roseicitreum antarcticum]
MTIRLAHICRHPIKSIGYEETKGAVLSQGRPLPFDRIWAVAHADAGLGRELPDWAPKRSFLRGAGCAELMAIACESHDDGTLTLTHPRAGQITVNPDLDGPALTDWLRPLWPANRPAPAHLCARPGPAAGRGALADTPAPNIAVLNLASLRDLSQRTGQDLSIHRWRGNLWLDGLAPWAEFDLIGQTLQIGSARLRITARITRCKATTANPATGAWDADTLGALNAGYGHADFGVYAVVEDGGAIAVGDAITRGTDHGGGAA